MRINFNLIFVIFNCSLSLVNSLNILGVFPFEGKSHFIAFEPYLLELAKRGHNVTVISYFPRKNPEQNYNDISLTAKPLLDSSDFAAHRSFITVAQILFLLVKYGAQNCKDLLANENVQNLWKTKTKFDLVIVEQFNSDCALGLAYKLGAPVIGLTSHMLIPWHYMRLGIPYNPSYDPCQFLEGGSKPTLYQRVERTLFYAYINLIRKYHSQRIDENTLSEYFENVPPLEDLAKQIKIMLVYQNFAFVGSKLLPTNFIEIGGLHVAKPKPLPDDLRKFIEDSKHGVIYISFGTIFRGSSAPTTMIQNIIDALAQLQQRVVWKWEEKSLLSNPKNIYFSSWLPQNDILAHPNVIAFYSHCGLMGTTEAIHHGVPMLAMPIFGDQPANAAYVEESGLGVQIQIREVTTENLMKKFKTILDPEFRENVKRISRLWHDRPMKPMDIAIYWTEFVGRNKNITLRTPAADVPYYQYFCLDVLAVLSSIIIIFAVVIKTIIKYLMCKNNSPGMHWKSKRE